METDGLALDWGMNLLAMLGLEKGPTEGPPEFVREIRDIRGVRVIRLRGPVGKEIGREAKALDKAASRSKGVFGRPLLFDFEGTTGWDFSTVSFLVLALSRRMPAKVRVGVINAPPELLAEMEMAKVDQMLRVFGSEELALAELSKHAAQSGNG